MVLQEDSWRYGFLQWHIIASEKLKFSSPTSFPLNTKRMSAYIWQHRLCIRFVFFPTSLLFQSLHFPARIMRQKQWGGEQDYPIGPWWIQKSPSPSCLSVLTPDVSSWCFQINTHASPKTECCSSVRFMDARGCLFILYCMVQSFYV